MTKHSSTSATTEENDIDMNETFYLRLTANKVSTANLSVEVSSPSIDNSKCDITTRTATVTSGTAINFGPIRCTTSGNHVFTFTLKEGSNTIGTAVTKTINVGTISVGTLQVTAPASAVVNTPVSITVRTIGTNDLPITNYASNFFVIISGDDFAEKPEGAQKMDGQSEKVIPGLKFNTPGTVKITIR